MEMTKEMALQRLSIEDLDLTQLPQRLDDQLLAMVETIASSPPPSLAVCPERYFEQSLRMMQAVLPKRISDDISGELFVVAYQRHLGGYSKEEITFLVDKAIAERKWFPTVAECTEIIGFWHRDDFHTSRKYEAGYLANKERICRRAEADKALESGEAERKWIITQDDVDALSAPLLSIGLSAGWLIRREDGKVVLSDG